MGGFLDTHLWMPVTCTNCRNVLAAGQRRALELSGVQQPSVEWSRRGEFGLFLQLTSESVSGDTWGYLRLLPILRR